MHFENKYSGIRIPGAVMHIRCPYFYDAKSNGNQYCYRYLLYITQANTLSLLFGTPCHSCADVLKTYYRSGCDRTLLTPSIWREIPGIHYALPPISSLEFNPLSALITVMIAPGDIAFVNGTGGAGACLIAGKMTRIRE